MGDDPLAGAAANCAEAYRAWAAGVGRPWRAWDDLVLADLGLPVSLPPNHASVLTPLTDEAVPDVVERMRAFFDRSPGGPFQVWSLWPTPDLDGFGFEPWSVADDDPSGGRRAEARTPRARDRGGLRRRLGSRSVVAIERVRDVLGRHRGVS